MPLHKKELYLLQLKEVCNDERTIINDQTSTKKNFNFLFQVAARAKTMILAWHLTTGQSGKLGHYEAYNLILILCQSRKDKNQSKV